jgi:hypothetical protein
VGHRSIACGLSGIAQHIQYILELEVAGVDAAAQQLLREGQDIETKAKP